MPSVFTRRTRWLMALAAIGLWFGRLAPISAAPLADPAGDTFGAGPDITSVNTSLVGANQNTLEVSVNFTGQIFAPSTFNINSLGGWMVFDTNGDANLSAALASMATFQGPTSGIDFSIDLFSEEFTPGKANLLNASLNTIASVPITFGQTFFTVDVPVSLLGVSSPNVGVIVGTFNNASDLAPNAATSVPEPATFMIFLMMFGVAAIRRVFRRPAPVRRLWQPIF